MTALQKFFAKNGRTRNIIFIVAASILIWMTSTAILQGHKFIYTAPLLLVIMLAALPLKPPSYFYSFCVGMLLSFGLYLATIVYLMVGVSVPFYVELFVGLAGFALLIMSVWQAILGEWVLTGPVKIIFNLVTLLGFLLIVYAVVKVEIHGIKVPEEQRHETY